MTKKRGDCFRLYERGHEVVGVEIAEPPVKELFEENNIEYDVENFPGIGNLYKVSNSFLPPLNKRLLKSAR